MRDGEAWLAYLMRLGMEAYDRVHPPGTNPDDRERFERALRERMRHAAQGITIEVSL